jgi:hypothetical protein
MVGRHAPTVDDGCHLEVDSFPLSTYG